MAGLGESKEWAAAAVAVGTRVTQERERLSMTKEALGERAGLASRYIWRVEEGLQNLQLGNLLKISEALGLTLSELLAGVEDLVVNPMPRPAKSPRGRKAAAAKR